jgi:hypothetical protein
MDLDLDINNYSIKDIEKFFRFKPNSKYTASDVELKEYELREQLLKSGHINKRFKRDLIAFLELARDWLIFVKCKPQDKQPPTTIPKNYKLDEFDTPNALQSHTRTDELQVRPETSYINVRNSEYYPGTLNPLHTRVISRCLNIDTRFRDNIYTTLSSNFVLQLPIKLNKVVSMQLSAIEFPVSFYGISAAYGNNFLYIGVKYFAAPGTALLAADGVTAASTSAVPVLDENGNPTTNADGNPIFFDERMYILEDSNYSAVDLKDVLNTLLRPVFPDNTYRNPESIFSSIQFDLGINGNGSGTGKLLIYGLGTYAENVVEIKFDFTKDINGNPDNIPISSKIGWNLGYLLQKYEEKNFYYADTVIEPANVRYIYLVIDDFNSSANNHFISVFNKSIISPNILARISIKGSYFSLIMQSDYSIISEPRTYFGPVDISKLKIQLIDEHGRILPMNNSNFSFCLNIKTLYDL